MVRAAKQTLTIALLLLFWSVLASAQATAPAATTPAATTTAATTDATTAAPAPAGPHNSREVRSEFERLVRDSAPEAASLLALDPGLLANDQFLTGYPEIASFVASNPEVRTNPTFYTAQFAPPDGGTDQFQKILEPIVILSVMSVIIFAITWLVRAVIEQRRWSRMARTQTEVHTRILDRFASSEELLAYMRTPAGAKFLESAPIAVDAGRTSSAVPVSRLVWSVQIGVVVIAAAIGLLAIAGRFDKESARGIAAMGTIALCIGGGFIASAVVSMILSKRLGLWQPPATGELPKADDVA